MRNPPASESDALRVAVVGAGDWGEQHARIFSRRRDTELVAIVGRNVERTAVRALGYGTTAYTDLDRMLEVEQPDLVTVCLPNQGHYETTRQLLQARVPILVEKPLVFRMDEADDLIATARAKTTFFGINFNHRFGEPVLRAKAAVDAGFIGEPVFATWRFGGEANRGSSTHGNLIETQCHGFDMLEHMFGPIATVMAQMTNKTFGVYSTMAIAIEFENGAVGSLLGTYDSSYAYPDTQLVELNGTLGRAVIRDTVRSLELSRLGDEVSQVWQAGYFNDEARDFAGTFDRHVEQLVVALREGAPPPIPAEAGRRALRLALASIRSYETGKRISTDEC